MTASGRAAALLVACVLHLALLAPLAGDGSAIVEGGFWSDADRTLNGEKPYDEVGFEYPPLALPLLLGPGVISDDADSFGGAFAWEMILADLAIVALIACALPGSPRRIWAALGAYTAGIVLLSGLGPLPDSAIDETPLALARFDLVPAALVLAAVLARAAGRSATWSALLGLGAAVKAFPAALFPVLARGERRWGRVVAGAAVPLVGAAALVLALGDEFGSAIGYHSGRDLQVEAVAASPILLAHLLGTGADAEFGSGSWNLVAGGAGAARLLSIVVLVAVYALTVRQVWRRRPPPLEAATAALVVIVVFAPLLSPQFLLWVLPVSAAAYGLRLPNLVLLAAFALTAYVLSYYGGVEELAPRFVLAVSARNALLLVYAGLVLAPLLIRAPAEGSRAAARPLPA